MGKIKKETKETKETENIHPHDLLGQGANKKRQGNPSHRKKSERRRNDMDLI